MTEQITKLANALYRGADMVSVAPGFGWQVAIFKRIFAGLWVGGEVAITDEELRFSPNALNRSLHQQGSIAPVHIPIADIKGVKARFGILTGIIDVTYGSGVFTFRCFGATSVARDLALRVGG